MSDEPMSVAEMRKDLGDVLNRAFYKNEVVEVAKREKSVALIVSSVDKPAILGMREIAAEQNMDSVRLIELLHAVPEEKLRAILCETAE
jgi:hypothetical protein